MLNEKIKEQAFNEFIRTMNKYATISSTTANQLKGISKVIEVESNTNLVVMGDIPNELFFIYKGILRSFVIGGENFDKEVNKNFFNEGRVAASIVASLKNMESEFFLQTLEDSILVVLDHTKYRLLMADSHELKNYQIAYLEKHWVI